MHRASWTVSPVQFGFLAPKMGNRQLQPQFLMLNLGQLQPNRLGPVLVGLVASKNRF